MRTEAPIDIHQALSQEIPPSCPPKNPFEFPEPLRPLIPAEPYYLPETITYLEELMSEVPEDHNYRDEDYMRNDIAGGKLLYQILETQDFLDDIGQIDDEARINLRTAQNPEKSYSIRNDALSKISGKVVEYASYIHIRNHLPPDFYLLSPRETYGIYNTPYMKSELKNEPKTEPDGLIFAHIDGNTYLASALEYTAYSDNVHTTPDDSPEEIATKIKSKQSQKSRKEEQLYLHVNGTVPKQLLVQRSAEWRAELGRRLHERFPELPDTAPEYSEELYRTILAMPEGQPIPFELSNGFPVPLPVFRGMIREFSHSLVTDLDEIHWYALNEPIPIPEEEFFPPPSYHPHVITLPLHEISQSYEAAAGD